MLRTKPPLPKGGASAPPRRGDKRPAVFHIGLYFRKVPAVNPSVKNQRFLPAPFRKGAPACRRCQFRTMAFYESFFPCPARYRSIERYRAFSDFQSAVWERSTPQKPQTKTGAEAETPHPSQSEGSIPAGSSRGILKGGTIRAGASCSPLEPASLLTFLPEQESKALLASTCRRLRLYLPPGGRWLGAKPQVGGSQRAHSQLDCQ